MQRRNLLMHQAMLGDRVRLDAYDKALSQVITPGAIVADLGAGVLPLTALALRHGAARVYAIEADPELVRAAERVIAASGWSDRVTLVPGDARLVRLPEQVDVIAAELMGNLGPEEEMPRLVRLLARRNLRPGGALVPRRLVTNLVPIQFDDEGWGVWRDGLLDLRLGVLQEIAGSGAHLHFFTRPATTLGAAVPILDTAARDSLLSHPIRLSIDRPGTLQAIAGYFEAILAPGVRLANFPSYPGCNWAVWIWPVRHTTVAAGDSITARVLVPRQRRVVTDWRLDCRLVRGKGEP